MIKTRSNLILLAIFFLLLATLTACLSVPTNPDGDFFYERADARIQAQQQSTQDFLNRMNQQNQATAQRAKQN